MGAPSPPSNTTSNVVQKQTSEMDPKLYALLYGSSTAPGSLVLANASKNAQMMQGVQDQDSAALQKFFGYSPSSSDIAAAGSRTYAAEGGEVKERGFASGGASTVLDPATAMIGVTPYFDPTTGRSTNPYFNQAVQSLNAMPSMAPQFQQATDLTNAAATGLLGQSGYTPQQIQAQQAQTYQMQGPQQWNSRQAERYMDPYARAVIDQQTYEAQRDYMQKQNQLAGQAISKGAFGGTRQALTAADAARTQSYLLDDIRNKGLSQAYNTALQQFNTAQGQGLQAGQANLNAAQQVALANQQANLQAQTQNQQAGLTGQGLNLQALNQAGGLGQNLAGIGTAQGAYGTQQAQNWGAAGQTLQNLAQQYFNTNQQSAQNIWGGVGTAAAPGISAVSGQPWGGVSTGATASAPSYWGKKTGGTLEKRGKK